MRRRLQTYCFSPPVMAATAIIELSLMVYTLWKYRNTKIGRIAAALLFFLALFQVAEYNVCEGFGLSAPTWSRIGFMVIALLPPLGIHLALTIARANWRWLRWAAYLHATIWILIFGLTERMFADHACGGNYIIFHIKPGYGVQYTLYYYFWLFVGIGLSAWLMRKVSKKQRESLALLIVGYLIFMVPTSLVTTIKAQTMEGLPSILCGFAVFFAILLAFGILPNELEKPKKGKK